MRTHSLKAKGWQVPGLTHWASMLFLALSMLVVVACPGTAEAAESSTLTIMLTHTHEGKTTLIEGVTAEAYQVAKADDRLQSFELMPSFTSLGIDFEEDYQAEVMWLFAKQAAAIVQKDGTTGISRTSGEDGALHFGSLEYGVYLVRETGATGVAAAYREFDPFLISVPQIDEGQVTYDVISYPKVPMKTGGDGDWLKPDPDPDPYPDPDSTPDPSPDRKPNTPDVPGDRLTTYWPVIPSIPGIPRTDWRWHPDSYEQPRRTDTNKAIKDLVLPSTPAPSAPTVANTTQPNTGTAPTSVTYTTPQQTTTEVISPVKQAYGLATTSDQTSWTVFQATVALAGAFVFGAMLLRCRRHESR